MKLWVKVSLLLVAIAALSAGGLLLIYASRPANRPGEITVTPAPATPGGPIIVQGYAWQPGTPLVIALRLASSPADDAVMASTTADGRGRFVVSFVLPASAPWDTPARILVVAHPANSLEGATFLLELQRRTPEPSPVVWQPTATPPLPTPTTTPCPTATPQPSNTPALPEPTATATPPPPPSPEPTTAEQVWWVEYYPNPNLSGIPTLALWEERLDHDWGTGAPDAWLPADDFSARWQGSFHFAAGAYRFAVTVDDGARLWIDGHVILDAWQEGGTRTHIIDARLPEGVHVLVLEYYEHQGQAVARLSWGRLGTQGDGTYPDWRAEYYANRQLANEPLAIVNDPDLAFEWGDGSPGLGLPADDFSVRWTRRLNFGPGLYRFHIEADDGIRLWIDDVLLLDHWRAASGVLYTVDRFLEGEHTICLEYFERHGNAQIRLWWEQLSSPPALTPPYTHHQHGPTLSQHTVLDSRLIS